MCSICSITRPAAGDCIYRDLGAGSSTFADKQAAPAAMTLFATLSGGTTQVAQGNVVVEGADAAAGSGTAYSITPGDTFEGDIDSLGDRDWVAIQLDAGKFYDINLVGADLSDAYLRVHDSAGNLIAENDDGGVGFDSVLGGFSVAESGTYYISAAAYDDAGTGTYSLTVEQSPVWSEGEVAAYLTDGFWNDRSLSRRAFDVAPGGSLTVNLSGLTPDGRNLAEQALLAWTYVLGIAFVEVAGAADITFDDENAGAFANSIVSGNEILSSIVNVSTDWLVAYGTSLDSYSFQTYIHEIGHALGLGHAGNYNGSAIYGIDNDYANDSWQVSIMSYFNQVQNAAVDASGAYAITPMIADILAVQELYGVAGNIRSGSDIYGYNSTAGGYYDLITGFAAPVTLTILDDGGIDTIDGSGSGAAQMIDLRMGAVSDFLGLTGNLVIAMGTLIENAVGGTGPDTLIGNRTGNDLFGGAGDDWLTGRADGDTLYGGPGRDYLRGGSGDDVFHGGDARDILRGGAGNDILNGGAGNDTLKGAWGDDIMTGGDGADVFKFKIGFGDDIITDFEPGSDRIRIVTGADDFGDLTIIDTGPDMMILFADVTILLEGISPGAIDAGDFIFG